MGLVVVVHAQRAQFLAHMFHSADQGVFDCLVISKASTGFAQKVVVNRLFIVHVEQQVWGKAGDRIYLMAKHLRHGDCKDGIAHAEAPCLLESADFGIVLDIATGVAQSARDALPAGYQIFEWFVILERGCLEHGLVEQRGVYAGCRASLVQLRPDAGNVEEAVAVDIMRPTFGQR